MRIMERRGGWVNNAINEREDEKRKRKRKNSPKKEYHNQMAIHAKNLEK